MSPAWVVRSNFNSSGEESLSLDFRYVFAQI